MHYQQINIEAVFSKFLEEIKSSLSKNIRGISFAPDSIKIEMSNQYNQTCHKIKAKDEKDKVHEIALFKLDQLQGCCGVCVSYHSSIGTSFRGIGLGTILNRLRIEIARGQGYGLLICTDVETNIPQNKIMDANNWVLGTKFKNPKTGRIINLHYHKLSEE